MRHSSVKGIFVFIEIITPSSDDSSDLGGLAKNLGATNIAYVCLVSIALGLMTWFAIGFGEYRLKF